MAVEMFRGPDHMAMRIGCMISQDSSAAEQFANAEFGRPNHRGSCGPNIRRPLTAPNQRELSLRENPNQRTTGWRFGAEIAHKSILRANLHVASRASRAINQHRRDWRLVRIR